jgi:predicted LPLAT superfamily acyltransferase
MKLSWLKQSKRERGSSFMFIIGRFCALHMGRSFMRMALIPITLYFSLSSRSGRQTSKQFLSKALKQKVSWKHIFKHHYYFASTILDRVYMLTDGSKKLSVTIHNQALISNHINQKKGCILLGSHLGCFEAMRAAAMDKIPLKVLMHTATSQKLNQILYQLNPSLKESIIEVGNIDTYINVSEYIDKGYMVGMLGDRVYPKERTTSCDFFGEKAPFSLNPYILATLVNAPIILCFGLYKGKNHYDLYFELFSEKTKCTRPNREEKAAVWARLYAQRLEYYANMAPYNWFNFYDYWRHE